MMKEVTAKLDEAVEHALDRTAETLRDWGATDAEVEAELVTQRAQLAAWRVQVEADVRRFIDEPFAPSTRLQ